MPGLQESLEFDPSRLSTRGADTRQPASDAAIWLFPAAGAAILIAYATSNRWLPPFLQLSTAFVRRLAPVDRYRAAVWIALGLVVVLTDLLLLDDLGRRTALGIAHGKGWISYAGGLVAIAGFFRWLTITPRDKI